MRNFLGVVGGVGPLATTYFMKKVIEFTDAKKDQDHINMLVFNHAEIPDRTAYILGESKLSPYQYLLQDCQVLQQAGASLIVIPCNTSHYFFPELCSRVSVPIVNMQQETAKALKEGGCRKIGVMATTGTVSTGLFQEALKAQGLDFCLPTQPLQAKVMELIYDEIKMGKAASKSKLDEVSNYFWEAGCEAVILGCTELSMLQETFGLPPKFVDVLDVTARFVVNFFGKKMRPQKANGYFLI